MNENLIRKEIDAFLFWELVLKQIMSTVFAHVFKSDILQDVTAFSRCWLGRLVLILSEYTLRFAALTLLLCHQIQSSAYNHVLEHKFTYRKL